MEVDNITDVLADNSRYEEIPWILWHTGRLMTVFLQPFLCVFGFLGNFISVIIFLSKEMRGISSNIYLTSLSASSCIFLFAVFCVWLEVVNIPLVNKPVWCQLIVFMTYACSFLSVWFVVCITVENYIVTFHLTSALIYCTVMRARIVVAFLTCMSILLYCFVIWDTKVVEVRGVDICTENNQSPQLTQMFTYVDNALTLILPTVVTLILVKAILVKIACRADVLHQSMLLSRRERSLVRITRVLLAISLTFVIFSAPSQINKIRHLVATVETSNNFVYKKERIVQKICQIIYYISFSFNLIYYIIWSENYRESLKRLLCIRKCAKKKQSPSQAANNSRTINEKTAITAV